MFYRKWDDISIINHIMSKQGKKPLNSSFYTTNYPAVYAAAERIFCSWKNAIEACGLDYSTIGKYRVWNKETVINKMKERHKSGQSQNSRCAYKTNRPLYMAAVKRYKNWRMMTKGEIKREIIDLYDSGVDSAYPNMKEQHLYLLAAGMKRLGNGSWTKARKVRVTHENYRRYTRRIQLKQSA